MLVSQWESIDLVVFFWAKELESKPPAYVVITDVLNTFWDSVDKGVPSGDFEKILGKILMEDHSGYWTPGQKEHKARIAQYGEMVEKDNRSGKNSYLGIWCFDENMQPIPRDGGPKSQTRLSLKDDVLLYTKELFMTSDDCQGDRNYEAIRMKVAYCPAVR